MPNEVGDRVASHLKKFFNTFINPFAYDPSQYYSISGLTDPHTVNTPGKPLTDAQQMLDVGGRAAGLAIGWSTLALAVQQASRRKRAAGNRQKITDQLATSRPVLSFDPSLNDAVGEKALEEIGTEIPEAQKAAMEKLADEIDTLAQAAPDATVGWGWVDPVNPFNIVKSFRLGTHGDRGSANLLPVSLLVPAAALFAGWRLGEHYSDKTDVKQANVKLEKQKNLLDRLTYLEAQRMRQKSAGILDSAVLTEPASMGTDPQGFWQSFKGLWALWAVASMAAGYAVGRKTLDRIDPARVRLKELNRLARRRSLVEEPPQFALAEAPGEEVTAPTQPRVPIRVESQPRSGIPGGDPYEQLKLPDNPEASDAYTKLLP